MRINKIAISILVVLSLFTVPRVNNVESKDSVVLSAGTENEYVVPADASTIIESDVGNEFVQGNSKSLNFEKINLEGLSGNLNTGITDVYAKTDGTFIVLLTITNDSSSLVGELYAHSFLLIVDLNGIVRKSLNISTGEEGVGTSAIKKPENIGGMTDKIAAAYPTLCVVGNDVYVSYTGYTPDNFTYTNQYFSTDINFSSSSWSTSSQFNGATKSFAYAHNIYRYSNIDEKFVKSAELLLRSNYPNASTNQVAFEYAISNPINKTQTETRTFEVRTPSQMVSGINGAEITNSGFRGFDDVLVLPNGNTVGTVYVTYRDSLGNAKRAREICIWDGLGNLISYHAATHGNQRVFQYEISNANELYFNDLADDGMYLKKLNINTGTVEKVKKFPTKTSIKIRFNENTDYETKYEYFGYSYPGFEGAISAGAIVGTMDENFDVVSNNMVVTTPSISMNLIDDAAGNTFVYGTLNSNKIFANEPTVDTNSIAGQGWVNKDNVSLYGANNNVYFGSMLKVTDYAPAINVGQNVKVNIDDLSTQSSIDESLLSSIDVYDKFDFNEKNPANIGLSIEEINQKLISRINRNPNDLNADIEWESLGLDITKPGYNLVKFFVSDSNNQVSANSKAVNIISSQTVEDGELAIDASNFYIDLVDVESLTSSDVILNSNATAWNMKTGESLNVEANSTQLKALNMTKSDGVFKLELSAKEGSKVITKVITIFVGGVTNIDETTVLYANSFKVHLNDASSYTSNQAIKESDTRVYDVLTGKLLDKQLSSEIKSINNATQIGPVSIDIKYVDEDIKLQKSVIASVYDKTVLFGSKDAIGAKSVVFDVNEVKKLSSSDLRREIKNRSAVTAWNLSTGEMENYSFNEKVVETKVGEYLLTFTTDKKTKKDINIYVFNQAICNGNGCDSSNATEVISANDFSLLPSEVDGLSNETVIKYAKAKAIDLTTNETLLVNADYSAIKEEFGSYDVVFNTESKTTIGVYASVGDNLVLDDEYAIAASDTFFTMEEVMEFDSSTEFDTEILKRSGAKVWVVETNTELDPVMVDSSSTNYTEIDNDGYDVKYSFVSKDLVFDKTERISSEENNVVEDAITAKDFTITASEVENLNRDKAIDYAGAKSWLSDGKKELEVVSVDYSKVKALQGVYDVTFTNELESSITVQVFVGSRNRPMIDLEKNIVLFANDYEINEKEVNNITSVDHIKAAEVLIINKDTHEKLNIDYIYTKSIENKPGTYLGTFGTSKKDIANVTVTVISDDLKTVNFAVRNLMLVLLLIGLVVVIRLVNTKEKSVT